MPTERANPYGAFNYLISLNDKNDDPTSVFGGFSDVSGLGMDVNYSEYRNGNEKFNTPRKIPNTFKLGNVTRAFVEKLLREGKLQAWEENLDPAEDPFDVGYTPPAHTLNPVHLILVDDRRRDAQLKDGIFADVAPTVIGLLGLEVPQEMTGKDLLEQS